MQHFLNEEELMNFIQSPTISLDFKSNSVKNFFADNLNRISGRTAGSIFQYFTSLLIRSADYFIKHDKSGKSTSSGGEKQVDTAGSRSSPVFLNLGLWSLVNQLLQIELTEISVGVSNISMHFIKPIQCLCLHLLSVDGSADHDVLCSTLLQILRTLRSKHCGIAGGGSWQPPMQSLASSTGKIVLRYAEVMFWSRSANARHLLIRAAGPCSAPSREWQRRAAGRCR